MILYTNEVLGNGEGMWMTYFGKEQYQSDLVRNSVLLISK